METATQKIKTHLRLKTSYPFQIVGVHFLKLGPTTNTENNNNKKNNNNNNNNNVLEGFIDVPHDSITYTLYTAVRNTLDHIQVINNIYYR